jgi:hypothetical protein
LGIRRCPEDLVDALVVEPDRHPARGDEDGHAVAHDERPGVIHLEPPAAVEFDREDVERLPLSEPLKNAGGTRSRVEVERSLTEVQFTVHRVF